MSSNDNNASTLDRAAVENDTTLESIAQPHATTDTDVHMSKRKRFSGKVMSILHVHNDQLNVAGNVDAVTLAPSPGVTTGLSRLDEGWSPEQPSQGFRQLLQHPVDTVRVKAERKTNKEVAANLLSPEVTHAQDVELLRAQDTLDNADSDKEKQRACEDMETIKKARQDLFVRWTMDRHVLKLKRLQSKAEEASDEQSRSKISPGSFNRGWKDYSQEFILRQAEKYGGQYIGSFSEPPPATQETVSASVEKLLVASSPWQALGMHVRRIYRWEDRKETSVYLIAFMILWAYGALCAAGCLALIGQVVRRRFQSPSMEKLRQEIIRTEDSMSTAQTLTEQIEKRGAQSWIDPLIEDMGEWLLLQLGDLSNVLEVLLNFYEWRQPRRTAWTLVWIGIGCISFYLTPVWLLAKTVSLLSGVTFFGLFPIASRYPKYRLLASPIKWLFWDIPTHAEWAMVRLQVQGSRMDAEHSDTKTTVHGSYTCSSNKHGGRLVLTSNGVRFESFGVPRYEWNVPYDRMNRVEKVNTVAQVGSGKNLLLIDAAEEVYTANNVARRDEIFTQIVGYSRVRWQVVG